MTGYVRVFNNSGELYDNAQTRLVVGTINLVEKIADLATRPAPGEATMADCDRNPRDDHANSGRSGLLENRMAKSADRSADLAETGKRPEEAQSRSSSRASPNTSSSPSKAARTSRTRSRSGWCR